MAIRTQRGTGRQNSGWASEIGRAQILTALEVHPAKRTWLRLAITLAVLLYNTGANADRPNIVMIMCDDLGYADVGFNGSPDILTPELDKLAAAGTVCTSAYVVHPFCGPSRMGLMAGRYPHTFGAPFNLPNSGQGYEEYNRKGIPISETLISTVLQKSGYSTAVVGKWHMGVDSQYHPNNRGFDEFYGFLGGGHDYFSERYVATYARQVKAGKKSFNDYIVPLEHNGKQVVETEYMTDAISREGARFINDVAGKQNPFFLYVAYNAPHQPLQAKTDDLKLYAHIRNEKRRTYAAMVHAVDRGVGTIVDALKSKDAFENTLIVFLSDNGGKLGAGAANNTPLKQGKGSVCEGGVRVPMFFHWPGKVPAGAEFSHPVSSIDFYPTFAGLAEANVPATLQLDGKDIWVDFIAGRNPRKGEPLFALRYHAAFGNLGVRQDQWKASCIGKKWRLFNIETDVGETRDVSNQHPEILQSIIRTAENWSQDHVTPQWFDNTMAGKRWVENDMPNYQAIFPPDRN